MMARYNYTHFTFSNNFTTDLPAVAFANITLSTLNFQPRTSACLPLQAFLAASNIALLHFYFHNEQHLSASISTGK